MCIGQVPDIMKLNPVAYGGGGGAFWPTPSDWQPEL